jgi:hypothetical protein
MPDFRPESREARPPSPRFPGIIPRTSAAPTSHPRAATTSTGIITVTVTAQSA